LRLDIDKRMYTTVLAAFATILVVALVVAMVWNVVVWLFS